MPWVRLHALKDYLDMPLTAARYDNLRVTFNLVPSLLDQVQIYLDGGTDRHLELSRIEAEALTPDLRREILRNFFAGNPERMILPYPRYAELYQKQVSASSDKETIVGLFSSQEMRDLQVWSNLTWVDPMFRREQPLDALFAKGRHYSEEDKAALLDWELGHLRRIIPAYRSLAADGKIEISFTPYYHPILPLLCDSDVALEALPSLSLPKARFQHVEDAERQIAMAVENYRENFGRELVGMWPSEGSVSDKVLELAAAAGLKWLASDEEVLRHSLTKSGLKHSDHPIHRVYEHASGVRMLFRDHALSDRIGFVYSTWRADKAVADFMGHLRNLHRLYENDLNTVVVPIILDGENAWEYFPDDGTEFLDLLYRSLSEAPEIETITFSEAVDRMPAAALPRVFAGSWINHNFRIWIGHPEDNTAWDLLSRTRDELASFELAHPDFDPDRLSAAWRQIYIAEGSDWCWWYGDEHRGPHNEAFDRIFRQHLIAVYELLGLDVPADHRRPIFRRGEVLQAAMPDGLVTPIVDGRLTHFYEWAGAGYFDCTRTGGAMHAVDQVLSRLYFAFDRDSFHIRLDFKSKMSLESVAGLKVTLALDTPESHTFRLDLARPEGGGDGYRFACRDMIEFTVDRDRIWKDGYGPVGVTVILSQDDELLESWPEQEPLQVAVPRRYEEMFWPN
jgi:alpha-amylase/alpha-mannosidase (GH57 family)